VSLLVRRRAALTASLTFALVALALPIDTPRAADGPAATLIAGTAAKVIEIIKDKPPGPDRQAAIRQVLLNDFDLAAMGRSALGTHWNASTPDQQKRFLAAVVDAEARVYSERFGQYGGQTLVLGKVADRGNGVTMVDSKLNQTSGQPITIQWEVRDAGSGLRITDVRIEGVSMVTTRRSDFNSYIQGHGGQVDALITELENRGH
jgi:phospholipid transport system substrate-binding protein